MIWVGHVARTEKLQICTISMVKPERNLRLRRLGAFGRKILDWNLKK